jgi:hypothetical protein
LRYDAEKVEEKSKLAREDKASDHASSQSNPSRNSRNESQAQVPQGQVPNVQQMQQMHQMHPQMYNRDPYSQQHMMSSQYSGEQVYPWQLQGMQNLDLVCITQDNIFNLLVSILHQEMLMCHRQ